MILKYEVKQSDQTINQILTNELGISSRLLYKLIKGQKVLLNNSITDTRNTASTGDLVTIDLNYEEDNSNIIPTKINLDIIYEDDAILVINKPSGIATHPSMSHFNDSLSNGVKYYFDTISLHKRIRPVNRLDFYTSGIVIFAKNEYVQECLIKQMASNTFKKEYLAICEGAFSNHKGTINTPIARKENSIIERCISTDGKPSITHYEVLKELADYSLVKCILETGRTHQIRVHMASIGHPLLGDTMYGNSSNLTSGQALHCYKVSFCHPVSQKKMKLSHLDSGFNSILKDFDINLLEIIA